MNPLAHLYCISAVYLELVKTYGHGKSSHVFSCFQLDLWILSLFARSASSLSRCQLINKSQKLVGRKLSEKHWSLKVISCQILHEHSYYLRVCLLLHWIDKKGEEMKFIAYCYISFIHCVELYYIVSIVHRYFSCNWFRNENRKMPGPGPDID